MYLELGFLLMLIARVLIAEVRQHEFCQWETFNASCPSNDVILITSASYGRMKVGRCLTVDYNVGCHGDVMEAVSSRCSGRRSCSVTVPDPELFRLQPCRKDLVAYLEATYKCVHISGFSGSGPKETGSVRPSPTPCNGSGLNIPSSSGYLANYAARLPGGYGSQRCPWTLEAPSGQRINVTLHDFTAPRFPQTSPAEILPRQVDACPPLVVLIDTGNADHVIRTCDVRQKKRLTFTSQTGSLQVFIPNGTANDSLFLLHYQVTGCANLLNLSKDTWASRSGENLLVSCNHSSEKWHLVCRGNEWVGTYGNCSSATVSQMEEARVNQQQVPIGLLLAIAIGAIVGVTIGCIFLLMVFVFRKRLHRQRTTNEAVLMDLYKSRDNIYKTIDIRSAQLPPEMTCMLDVIGGTTTTTPTPSSGIAITPGCDCGLIQGGPVMRPGPHPGALLGGVSNGLSGGRATVAPLGPDEVYFSEETLRQTLGRCRGARNGVRPPPPPERGAAPQGGLGLLPGDGRSLDRVIYDDAAGRQQVSPVAAFFPPKGETQQATSGTASSCSSSSRGFFIPHDSSSSAMEEKLYEKRGGGGCGGAGGVGVRQSLDHVTRIDYDNRANNTTDETNTIALLKKL